MDIQTLIEYFKSKADYLKSANDLYNIFNGNITPYIEERITKDFKSISSQEEAKSRMSTINILPKLVNKLSKVMAFGDFAYLSPNQDQFEEILETLDLKNTLVLANKMLNLFGCVAIEPVFNETESFLRVLPANTFLVYSENEYNSNKVTHFIKILVQDSKRTILGVTSAEEYVEFDLDGKIYDSMPNKYKTIPYAYVKRDTTNLMPSPKQDDLNMITLLPLLLTDGNFALKFQAFSIIYTINAEFDSKVTYSPNGLWNLKSSEDGTTPSIGNISPSLNIEDLHKSIYMQYSLWLDTKNVKSSTLKSSTQQDNLSGIAKLIDDADVYDDVLDQVEIFKKLQQQIFKAIDLLSNSTNFGQTFISYEETSRIPELPLEKINRIILKRDSGLISKIDAIREANEFNSDTEAEEYLKEIEVQNVQRSDANQN
jgi:hypothetical protein